MSSWPGLTRPSILFAKRFCEERWTRGSSPRVTHVAVAFPAAPTEPQPALARCSRRNQRGPRPMWNARVLIAAVLVVGVASSADARRRHHGYSGDGERSSGSTTLDQWR